MNCILYSYNCKPAFAPASVCACVSCFFSENISSRVPSHALDLGNVLFLNGCTTAEIEKPGRRPDVCVTDLY